MLTLLVEVNAPTESGKMIPPGTKVEYLGHVLGGMVSIRWNGEQEIIHPGTTKELFDGKREVGQADTDNEYYLVNDLDWINEPSEDDPGILGPKPGAIRRDKDGHIW